jgi:hypothetical protein
MCAQLIKQGNIFGRIGTGIGKGLAEQVPKEIERSRLASGLKQLGEQKGLTPFQQFAGLASVPGITPQMIQSGSELLRQQARGQALADFNSSQNQPKPNPFSQGGPPAQQGIVPPSITQEKPLAEIQQGAIPPTIEEEFARAGQLYKANPAQFGNDPQKALDFVAAETERNQAINQAYQQKHENLNKIQDNVVSRLQSQSEKLNTQVPAELYSKIEDEAIQATKSRKEGGEGLTEQQAMKKYGDKLNDASRDFSKINEIGSWGITLRPAQSTLRSMKELQNKMEKLDQTDNFAKKLISKNKLSPKLAYAIAEPVSRVPQISSLIKGLPTLEAVETIAESKVPPNVSIPKTLEIAPRLAELVKNNEKASPLAIAYEIEKKGYDPETWLQYVTDHAPELNLRQRQSEQASTPINIVSPWNDWWLSSFSGLD